jgi:hypothetical protein
MKCEHTVMIYGVAWGIYAPLSGWIAGITAFYGIYTVLFSHMSQFPAFYGIYTVHFAD